MKGDDLSERLLASAVGALRIDGKIDIRGSGKHVAGQLARAGTAVGAHYEEARSAESRADFVHKLRLAAKEARETRYWLRLASRARLVDDDLAGLCAEGDELVAILTASVKTARMNRS